MDRIPESSSIAPDPGKEEEQGSIFKEE